MQLSTLDLVRCPYCGGHLALVTSLFHREEGDELLDGILGCHCCTFPLVDGIPVLLLSPASADANAQIQAGRPDLARRALFGIADDARAARFDDMAVSATATYRDVVDALGPDFEGGYFLYRFSDPTYLVAHAVVRAVARTVLAGGGRAIDVCGGSGHLTRSLLDVSSPAPVLADLYYSKIWLARRFTAPGCEGVCCDGNAPLPFARGAFRYAMCTDAFMYIWTKRRFVGEMTRLVDDGRDGAVLIGHTHNAETWSPSHGQALSPDGYRDLFEGIAPRLFAESALFEDVVRGGPLDLGRRDTPDALAADPALTLVATRNAAVFAPHALETPAAPRGEYRLNPLYAVEDMGDAVRLRLRFPSPDYEDEYSACRRYLPPEALVPRAALGTLDARVPAPAVAELVRQRVVLDLPRRYY
ncbi:MAG: hypothetical protein ABUS56_11515 [Acidobacteriota bacterium]